MFTVDELEQNLKSIICINADAEVENEISCITYNEISDAKDKIERSKIALVKKISEGRNKIKVQQQSDLLPLFIERPSLLVGKKVKHKCREENSREVSWYRADLRRLLCERGRKSEYIVKYDEDEWEFPLLIDLSNGDLIKED